MAGKRSVKHDLEPTYGAASSLLRAPHQSAGGGPGAATSSDAPAYAVVALVAGG